MKLRVFFIYIAWFHFFPWLINWFWTASIHIIYEAVSQHAQARGEYDWMTWLIAFLHAGADCEGTLICYWINALAMQPFTWNTQSTEQISCPRIITVV